MRVYFKLGIPSAEDKGEHFASEGSEIYRQIYSSRLNEVSAGVKIGHVVMQRFCTFDVCNKKPGRVRNS